MSTAMSLHNKAITDLDKDGLPTDKPLVVFKKLSKNDLLAIHQYALDNCVAMDVCLDAIEAYIDNLDISNLSKPYADIYTGVWAILENRK